MTTFTTLRQLLADNPGVRWIIEDDYFSSETILDHNADHFHFNLDKQVKEVHGSVYTEDRHWPGSIRPYYFMKRG